MPRTGDTPRTGDATPSREIRRCVNMRRAGDPRRGELGEFGSTRESGAIRLFDTEGLAFIIGGSSCWCTAAYPGVETTLRLE